MIYSVADLAQKLGLREETVKGETEWHGRNPSGAGAEREGFWINSDGTAFDRKLNRKYTSREVAELAGIEPNQYAPVAEFRARNGSANGHANGVTLQDVGVKAPDVRTLEQRGVKRATLAHFHVRLVTRSNRGHSDYRCWEYPAYFADGRAGRCRQKVCDPAHTNGQKYFWAGGDKDSMPLGYNLHGVAEAAKRGERALWLVESEVSTWLLHQAEVVACNPFGAGNKLGPLMKHLAAQGVLHVNIAFDCDTAGRTSAAKAAIAAKDAKLTWSVRRLPGPSQSGYDVADLCEACKGNPERIRAALQNLPVVAASELLAWLNEKPAIEEKPQPDSRAGPQPAKDATPKNAGKKESQAADDGDKWSAAEAKSARLLAMLNSSETELFHTNDDECFITWSNARGVRGNYLLADSKFHRLVAHRYQRTTGKVIDNATIENVMKVLEGRAFEEGETRQTWVRTALHEGRIYLDLCDESWQAVEIGPDVPQGWRVIANPPVHFRRAKGMEPLPVPERGGDLNRDLRPLLNAGDESNWIMMVAWLVGALRPPKYPYPVLSVHGEQESGKSSLCRILRRLIDPNYTSLIGTSTRDERDLAIIAKNSFVIAFDNLSGMKQWFNDVLCSLVTEGGFRTRKLHSNDEEMLFRAQRPILLNGINENVGQNDLRRRSLKLWLPPMPPEQKRDEADLWANFERVWPRVLGCLCDALAVALEFVDGVELPHRRGMVDFARWIIAAEPVLPWESGQFAKVYLENQQAAIDAANDASPLTQAILDYIQLSGPFRGTAKELLQELNRRTDDDTKHSHGWPHSFQNMGTALNRIAPNLRATGLDVTRDSNRQEGRVLCIRRIAPDSVLPFAPASA